MPPRYARGRRPVPSPRAQAVGSQSGKKSLQARFFAAASPTASALAGFPPAPSRNQLAHAEILNFELYTLFGIVSEKLVGHSVLLCPPKLLYYKKNVIWGMKHELGLHV
ncbi:MAG TPA: hypothetical protein PLL08_03040 [Bacteroidales bacterium]|nr:hypothetical protein [Bacteroidales bacterium]